MNLQRRDPRYLSDKPYLNIQVDKRYPNVIRVTPVHLYNSFRDVHRFVEALLDSLDEIEHSV